MRLKNQGRYQKDLVGCFSVEQKTRIGVDEVEYTFGVSGSTIDSVIAPHRVESPEHSFK